MYQTITEPTLSIKQSCLPDFRPSLHLLLDVTLPQNPKIFSVLNGKPSFMGLLFGISEFTTISQCAALAFKYSCYY